jgi:hypothetical protein
MKMFKELASLKDAKIKSTIVSEHPSVTVNLTLQATKGCMTIEWTGYGQLFEYAFGSDLMGVDDYDDNGIDTVSIGGLPIDNISDFVNTLQNSGMDSVSKTVNISWDARKEEYCKAVGSSETFKKLFPGKIMFETLSLKEKQDVIIDYCIKNNNYKYYMLPRLEIVELGVEPMEIELKQFKKDRKVIRKTYAE